MPLSFCIFKSISKLLKSAKIPLTLRVSGKFPLYLPDKINGPSDERSGIWDGYTYSQKFGDNAVRKSHKLRKLINSNNAEEDIKRN